MKKQQVILIIILSVILAWIFNIFPGRFIVAKISTWPLLNRFKILSPQAPIVINNRETVRVSDAGDVLETANSIKSKISAVILVKNGSASLVGTAVNLTSDGSFVTGADTFKGSELDNYYVLLDNGQSSKIIHKVSDPATNLIFLKSQITNLPVARLSTSKDLSAGDKVLFAKKALQDSLVEILVSFVSVSQKDFALRQFSSDYPRRGFWTPSNDALLSGEAIVTMDSEIAGIWNGTEIISSDVLKKSTSLYINNSGQISRPSFGITYQAITKNAASLSGGSQGAKVITISPGSAAQKAGLQKNDLIISVDGSAITENTLLEELLEKYNAGNFMVLTVMRGENKIQLTLKVEELK